MNPEQQMLKQQDILLVKSLKSKSNSKKSKKKPVVPSGKSIVKLPPLEPDVKDIEGKGEGQREGRIRRLRARLEPITRHPVYGPHVDLSATTLASWLDDSDQDVLLAECSITKEIHFRQENRLDRMLTKYIPHDILSAYYPGGLCGVDKEGSPVSYEMPGLLDLEGLMRAVSRQDLKDFRLYQLELLRKHMKNMSYEKGRPITSVLMIVNMTGAGKHTLWGPGLVFWAEMLQLQQTFYPGLIKELVIVQPSMMAPMLYAALRPYLGSRLRSRLAVLGNNFKEHLLMRIDKHELPAFLGGYRCDTDGNPMCTDNINWESKVPWWSYFTDDRMHGFIDHMTVLAGCREVKELHVPLARSRIMWEVITLNQPFDLTIYRDRLGDARSEVFARRRITEKSSFRKYGIDCKYPGRYLVQLDNRKNMAVPLHIAVRMEVVVPDTVMASREPGRPLGDSIDFESKTSEEERRLAKLRVVTEPHWQWLDAGPVAKRRVSIEQPKVTIYPGV